MNWSEKNFPAPDEILENPLIRSRLLKAKKTYPSLPPNFFLKPTLQVARSLIGKGLFVRAKTHELVVAITEVEAYLREDEASHSFRGPTKRNQCMFERGGTSYVYLSYGINFCLNVATRGEGIGEAVLFRAAAPLAGIEQMGRNRGCAKWDKKTVACLLNGPGKLTQALGIDLGYNGKRFDTPDLRLVDLGLRVGPSQLGESPRIGISKAVDLNYRYFWKNSPWLSRKEDQQKPGLKKKTPARMNEGHR